MLGEFTDWSKDWRDDMVALQADIELERLDMAGVYDRVQDLVEDSLRMVEVAYEHDETIEEELDDQGSAETFVLRIEGVIRELEWTDPDSRILRDLNDAVNGFHDNDHQPDLIV